MRAAIQAEHNSPVVLSDRPEPIPGAGEVLVRVLACGLNHLDLWLRQGDTGDALSLPRVPGTDVLGIVESAGPDVDRTLIGTCTLVYPGSSCGECEYCEKGTESACRTFKILGYHVDGGYADYVIAPETALIPVPDEDLAWSAVPVAYITAWNALVTKGGLQAASTVAIWGAAGGLGNAALRLAVALGARPVAIVGDIEKERWLRSNGYEGQVVLRGPDVVRDIRALTGKRGVDMVLDHVGAHTFEQSLGMLAAGGHLAFCGVSSGHSVHIDLRRIFGRQLTIAGTWIGDRTDLREVVTFLTEHPEARPTITGRFPLENAPEAQEELSDPSRVGKLVLIPGTGSVGGKP